MQTMITGVLNLRDAMSAKRTAPKNVSPLLAKLLREYRLAIPISQEDLARTAGIAIMNVNVMEKASGGASLYYASRLARLLGIPHELREFLPPKGEACELMPDQREHNVGRAPNLYPDALPEHPVSDRDRDRVAAVFHTHMTRAMGDMGVTLKGVLAMTGLTPKIVNSIDNMKGKARIPLTAYARICHALRMRLRLEELAAPDLKPLRRLD